MDFAARAKPIMAVSHTSTPISKAEVESHLEYIQRVLTAESHEERRAALSEQLLAFGPRSLSVWQQLESMAADAQKDFYRARFDELTELWALWMKGKNLTRRPDEPERRALAGLLMLEERPDLRQLYHYAVVAILELPEGHPRRDVARARQAIMDELAWLKDQGESTPWIFLASALALAYRERFASDEELLAWEAWAAQAAPHLEPEDALPMWSAIEGYYVDRAATDAGRWLPEAERIRALIEALPMSPRMRAVSCLSAAQRYANSEDQRPIANLYQQALETRALEDNVERLIATKEARLRTSYGEFERVVELVAPRLGAYEEDYVTAIRTEECDASGEEHAEANALLAIALAKLNRWREAVETIERGKCLRQRFTLALRQTPAAAKLLELEGELYALSRGIPAEKPTEIVQQVRDWFAQGLSPEAKFREEYRKLLPEIKDYLPRPLSLSEITCGLRDGEAALSLGIWWPGTIAALLVKDEAVPVWTTLREDITQSIVSDWLAGGEGEAEGFLLALERGMSAVDPRPALVRLLSNLDPVLGEPVAAALELRGLNRLVVLPHNFLRLAPLWALKSWEPLQVRMAPGAFALTSKRKPVVHDSALIVANPTLDLPLATTEAMLAEEQLRAAGLETQSLLEREATEEALSQALETSSLFHFAGHGIAALTDSSMSALLVHPVWERSPVADASQLVALERTANENPRLHIDREEGSPRRKLFFEYARRGTFYAEADHDTVLLAGELWRAGDILVQGTLAQCALAFLCACSSGLGSIERLEEASGLPAALQIAGVGCVICTGWPVADEITVLFADEFYTRLLSQASEKVDVVSAGHGAAMTLRTMGREQAVQRIKALAEKAADKSAGFRLKVFARRLANGEEQPFAHPFDSGAFYVTGAAEISIETTKI
jgi:CHAT domain-containing protein